MSDQQHEINLEVARALGRIDATLTSMDRTLAEHTAQDAENFASLSAAIAKITGSRATAMKWGAGFGAAIMAAAEAIRAFSQ